MSKFDSSPGVGLDRSVDDLHHELIVDLAATLDLEAGLREVLIPSQHARLVADLESSLDIEAGLAAIVPIALEATEPVVTGTTPDQANAGQPRRETVLNEPARAAAFLRQRTSPTKQAHPVFTVAAWRSWVRTFYHGRLIAAIAIIAFVVTVSVVTVSAIPHPPPPRTTALDIRDYGVTKSCKPDGTVVFTLAVTAHGSGTLDYIWRPNKVLSNERPSPEVITFTGSEVTKTVDYIVPHTYSRDQLLRSGMTVEITEPEARSGATYDGTCR